MTAGAARHRGLAVPDCAAIKILKGIEVPEHKP
jgi:hypothetical protein